MLAQRNLEFGTKGQTHIFNFAAFQHLFSQKLALSRPKMYLFSKLLRGF